MNAADAGRIATVLGAILLALAIRYVFKRDRQQSASVTVEAEADTCREVIACIGQHHPSEPDEYQQIEEPQLYLVHEMERAVRQA